MEEYKRIRVLFEDDDILSEAQKSEGLNRSWVLLKPREHDTVSDAASHLLRLFQLYRSCPHGLILTISGFVLPPHESTHILKDNEIIRVRKRRDNLLLAGNNGAIGAKTLRPLEILAAEKNNAGNKAETSRAAEKQPVNSGVLLLANEEFEKEKGGYESDDPEEDDEEDLLEGNKDSRKRKRKAVEKLHGSKKKKKQHSESMGNFATDVCKEKLDNTLEAGELSKKIHSCEEKKDEMDAEDNVENNEETAKSSDKIDASLPGMNGNTEVQANIKETEDAKISPKEKKKVPSRSARRKYVKRRFLKEMAKIQKQNATCESEGLRNWKEDHAKDERKKVDGQLKGQKKWKKPNADPERNETDDGPKGLLHLKLSPQSNRFAKGPKRERRNKKDYFLKRQNQNDDVDEQRNQNGDWHESPTQNGDGLEQKNQRQGDVHEQQSGQKSDWAQELPNQNCDASNKLNEESDEEREVVPIVIRPGHIRFEPLEKGEVVQQHHAPLENFQWNGITSKKKGQQWGKENRSFTPRNAYKQPNKEHSEILSNEKEKQSDEDINFDKLPPLTTIPKEGDLIAYRVLELSSSWTPELSPFRVGKVSWFDAESNQTILVAVPEYPLVSKKDDEDVQLDDSLYKEDGSLEIDFSSLIDARIFNKMSSGPGNEALTCVSEGSIDNENPPKPMLPSSNNQTVVPSTESNKGEETQPPTSEIGGFDIWDQLSESLNAKKEQLCKENGWESWGKIPKKVQPASPVSIWGKNAKTVQPPSAGSGRGKNVQKAQPSQDSNWGTQSSGSKSWSYKALRGSALGPTMARLRSTNNNT